MPEDIIYKSCKTCNESKELSSFYFRKDSRKRRNDCKQCWAKKTEAYRNTPAGKESRKREASRWFQSDKGKRNHRRCLDIYRQRYPERIKIMSAVAWAIRKGELIRPTTCEQCSTKARIEAHHHKGYAWENRFDIRWLCALCHRRADSA